jgi:hypothetical protein
VPRRRARLRARHPARRARLLRARPAGRRARGRDRRDYGSRRSLPRGRRRPVSAPTPCGGSSWTRAPSTPCRAPGGSSHRRSAAALDRTGALAREAEDAALRLATLAAFPDRVAKRRTPTDRSRRARQRRLGGAAVRARRRVARRRRRRGANGRVEGVGRPLGRRRRTHRGAHRARVAPRRVRERRRRRSMRCPSTPKPSASSGARGCAWARSRSTRP